MGLFSLALLAFASTAVTSSTSQMKRILFFFLLIISALILRDFKHKESPHFLLQNFPSNKQGVSNLLGASWLIFWDMWLL